MSTTDPIATPSPAPPATPPGGPAASSAPAAPPPEPPADGQAGLTALGRALRLSFYLLVGVMVAAIVGFLLKSIFVVEPHEVGVLLRFGRLVTDADGKFLLAPGSHFSLPAPIDERLRLPKTRQRSVESTAFWAPPPVDEKEPPPALKPGLELYTLTGDTSMVHTRWAARYSIAEPLTFAFAFGPGTDEFREFDQVLRVLLHQAVTHAAAGLGIDDVWRNRDDRFRQRVEELLRAQVAALGLGIAIERVDLLAQPTPPRQVKAAFASVMQAETDRSRLVQEAQGAASQTLSQAKSEAAGIVSRAHAYRQAQVSRAAGDYKYYESQLEQFRRQPTLIRQGLYDETLRRVLRQVEYLFVVTGEPGEVLRLDLGPDKRKPAAAPARKE